jgi:hypothetical protein
MKENRLSISSIKSGNVVRAGYVRGQRDMTDANRFVGFKVGEQYFSKLQDLKEFFGVRNLKELEFEADRLNQFGSVTAEFQNVSDTDCYFWGAYLWNGSFRVGTSADRLKLRAN